MKAELKEAYLRHHSAGKGATARLFDRMLFFSLVFGVGYFIARIVTGSAVASFFIGALAGGVYLLGADILFRIAFAGSVSKLRSDTARSILSKKLLLAPSEELHREAATSLRPKADCRIAVMQKTAPAAEDDIYSVLRKNAKAGSVVFVSVSGFTSEAELIAQRMDSPPVKLIKAADIAGLAAAYKPSEAEIDSEIIALYANRKAEKPKLAGSLKPGSAAKYLVLGAGTYFLSFISGAGLFLRSIASIVITFSVLAIGLKLYGKRWPQQDHS